MDKAKKHPIYLSKEEIQKLVQKVAREIESAYSDLDDKSPLLCVGILKGAWIFLADLVRELKIPVEVDFMQASSYGKAQESSGIVKIEKDLSCDIQGRDLLLVEEIIDTGRTLDQVKKYCLERGARSVRIASLLDKKVKRIVPLDGDFIGKEIEDKFVIGYGLDWAEKFRDLENIHYVEA